MHQSLLRHQCGEYITSTVESSVAEDLSLTKSPNPAPWSDKNGTFTNSHFVMLLLRALNSVCFYEPVSSKSLFGIYPKVRFVTKLFSLWKIDFRDFMEIQFGDLGFEDVLFTRYNYNDWVEWTYTGSDEHPYLRNGEPFKVPIIYTMCCGSL